MLFLKSGPWSSNFILRHLKPACKNISSKSKKQNEAETVKDVSQMTDFVISASGLGRGCGSVGRAVASNTRDLRFKSQLLIIPMFLEANGNLENKKTKNKRPAGLRCGSLLVKQMDSYSSGGKGSGFDCC